MAETFQVDVVTPEAVVWSGEADFISTRTVEGDIGILAGHEPTMAALGTGPTVVHHGNEATTIALHGGFLQIFQNSVTLLTDRATISEGSAEDALEMAQQLAAAEADEADGDEGGTG